MLKDELKPGNAAKQVTLEDVVNLRDTLEELLKQISSRESKLGGMTDNRDDTAKLLNGIRPAPRACSAASSARTAAQYDRAGRGKASTSRGRGR